MLKRLTLLLVLLAPVPVNATSWLVMQDGTGDYTEIQAAVDGCAVGDTVWVGPGRYDTFGQHWPHLNWIEIVGVTVDSLTIKALYPNTAIIGPESPVKVASQKDTEKWVTTIGIGTGLTNTWLVVEDLVFENMNKGIHLYPSGVVRRCRFNEFSDVGVMVDIGINVLIEDCVTSNCDSGIHIFMNNYNGLAKATWCGRLCLFDEVWCVNQRGINPNRFDGYYGVYCP